MHTGTRLSARFTCAILLLFLSWSALADENDLSYGVFIAHHPPDVVYTGEPAETMCEDYWAEYAITSCAEQNPRIDVTEPTVWYVLSAWCEDKRWCGTEFGFGDFNPQTFYFTDWAPCGPGQILELPTGNWPGPNSGNAFVTTGGLAWEGTFVPVYCFIGYGYVEGSVPLGVDPALDFAGWGNCDFPYPALFDATCLPVLGVFTDGLPCCPEGPTPTATQTWGRIKASFR